MIKQCNGNANVKSSRFEIPSSPEEEPIGDRVPTPDSDEEDILLEPRFKYEFVAGPDATHMLQHHIITAVAVHDKLIAVGTQTGHVWVMDHAGYTDHSTIPTVRPHRSPVTRLAMDTSGNYVISCANDGRVAITGLGTTILNHVLSLKFMHRSIALSPDFSKIKATPYFIVGERNLVLYEKGIFNYKESVIFRGGEKDGFISRIAWQNNYIAFINDGGTRIYDRVLEKMITLLNPSHDVDRVRSSRFPPTLSWLADDSLAVGWADTVTIMVIVEEHNSVATSKRAEIHFSWNLEGLYCSGISSVLNTKGRWKEIVIFGLRPDVDEDDSRDFCDGASMVSVESTLLGPPPRVQICVLQPDDFKNYELVAEDTLDMNARPGAQPCQFHMEGLPSCDTYFLLAPTQLVTVSECSGRMSPDAPVNYEEASTKAMAGSHYHFYCDDKSVHTMCSTQEATSYTDEVASTKALAGSVHDSKSLCERPKREEQGPPVPIYSNPTPLFVSGTHEELHGSCSNPPSSVEHVRHGDHAEHRKTVKTSIDKPGHSHSQGTHDTDSVDVEAQLPSTSKGHGYPVHQTSLDGKESRDDPFKIRGFLDNMKQMVAIDLPLDKPYEPAPSARISATRVRRSGSGKSLITVATQVSSNGETHLVRSDPSASVSSSIPAPTSGKRGFFRSLFSRKK